MKFHVIASGSSGNCYCIDHCGQYIFIDAGVSVSKVVKALGSEMKKKPSKLFITHEHADHIASFIPLVKKYSPVIYTSEKTAEILVEKGADPDKLFVLDADLTYDLGDFTVMPFNLMHDAAEPFGYKFDLGENIISFATDFGIVSDYMCRSIEGSDTLLLESNYEDELLKKSSYPAVVKSRIAGNRGHLSNKEALQFVGEMSQRGLKRCFLAHVSENSNDYELLDRYAKMCEDCYMVETYVIRQRSEFHISV